LLPLAGRIEEEGCLPEATKTRLMGMGLLRSAFPESVGQTGGTDETGETGTTGETGGAGGTFTGMIIALQELAYASFIPAWMLFENFMLAYPLHRFGSTPLQQQYLPGLLSLEKVGALAFTEPDTGSDPVQLRTRAEKVPGGWMINGSKRFITYSGLSDHMILFAKTGDRVTAFLVSSGREGYRAGRRERFMHERALDNGEVHLENYFAPEEHVIGEIGQGFDILLETEAVGKVAFSSLYVGLAERALDLSLGYAATRTHRGEPIGKKFQMIQVKLSAMFSKVEAMRSHLYQVSGKIDRQEHVALASAGLKLFIGTEVKAVTAEAMEVHGAYGLSEEYEVAKLYRAGIGAQAVMGSLDLQRSIIARELLGTGSCR
jgi:alkylation response protein AidB-like acyl-CoA dehydrogenase